MKKLISFIEIIILALVIWGVIHFFSYKIDKRMNNHFSTEERIEKKVDRLQEAFNNWITITIE